MVVVGRERGMGLAVARERQMQRLLRAGLADGAGDGDDFRPRARARRPREVAQAVEHVGNDEQRRILRKASRLSAETTASPAPDASAAATKSWPSRLSPLMAKNASPRAIVRVSME